MSDNESTNASLKPGDAPAQSWVDAMPAALRPYLRLARADRPIGVWLLLWPCWWSLALAQLAQDEKTQYFYPMILFAIGAFVMRSAGCAYNDIVDRDFDAQVERTKGRPIPAGQISVAKAWVFTVTLALIGLLVLLQLNMFTILLGLGAIPIVALYPFAKRFTNWPQAVLGLAFNWGALMGWAAIYGELALAPILLYGAGVFWTLGYDTIYAHQDKEDDILIGVKSTALKLGTQTYKWMNSFYSLTALLLVAAIYSAGGGLFGIFVTLAACLHLLWQIRRLDVNDSALCLRLFKANHIFGFLVFITMIITAIAQ